MKKKRKKKKQCLTRAFHKPIILKQLCEIIKKSQQGNPLANTSHVINPKLSSGWKKCCSCTVWSSFFFLTLTAKLQRLISWPVPSLISPYLIMLRCRDPKSLWGRGRGWGHVDLLLPTQSLPHLLVTSPPRLFAVALRWTAIARFCLVHRWRTTWNRGDHPGLRPAAALFVRR